MDRSKPTAAQIQLKQSKSHVVGFKKESFFSTQWIWRHSRVKNKDVPGVKVAASEKFEHF